MADTVVMLLFGFGVMIPENNNQARRNIKMEVYKEWVTALSCIQAAVFILHLPGGDL